MAERPGPERGGPIILVGLPGAGKSTSGALAAERLGWSFLDFDAEIERREGATIPTLFAQRGEPYFRIRERELTAELAGRGRMVLAPGGGWILGAGNLALLRPPGVVVYLRAAPESALRRLGAGRLSRPLLSQADPLAALGRLLAEREPFYATADVTIDTDSLDPGQVADRIARLAASPSGARPVGDPGASSRSRGDR